MRKLPYFLANIVKDDQMCLSLVAPMYLVILLLEVCNQLILFLLTENIFLLLKIFFLLPCYILHKVILLLHLFFDLLEVFRGLPVVLFLAILDNLFHLGLRWGEGVRE